MRPFGSLCKISDVKIFERLLLQFSHPISTKLYGKHSNQGAIHAVTFGGTLKFLLTQDHMELEISKRYSYSFHPMSIKLHEDIGYHGGIQTVTFLGNWSNFGQFFSGTLKF